MTLFGNSKLAFFTDIHGNDVALDAVLKHINASKIYCLGDMLSGFQRPIEVLNKVISHNVSCILGDHELITLGKIRLSAYNSEESLKLALIAQVFETINNHKDKVKYWSFLNSLPEFIELEEELTYEDKPNLNKDLDDTIKRIAEDTQNKKKNGKSIVKILICHGNPLISKLKKEDDNYFEDLSKSFEYDRLGQWYSNDFLNSCGYDIIITGHYHHTKYLEQPKGLGISTPITVPDIDEYEIKLKKNYLYWFSLGAVGGNYRDEIKKATYLIIDKSKCKAVIKRVDYDKEKVKANMEEAFFLKHNKAWKKLYDSIV